MDVLGTKVVVLILFLLIKLGSGLLPLLLDKVLQIKKVRTYMSLFVNLYLSLLISSATYYLKMHYLRLPQFRFSCKVMYAHIMHQTIIVI